MSSLQFWESTCTRAFNNDAQSSHFILFFESCKSLSPDKQTYLWNTREYRDELEQLGCFSQDNSLFSLSIHDYAVLTRIKSQARSQWHRKRQIELQRHLRKALQSPVPLLDITVLQRLALVQAFMSNHEGDVGSVPFIRGLAGLFSYQLQQHRFLVEWEMSEYVLTQNNEDAIDAYIRLLRGVLGLRLVNTIKDEAIVSQEAIYVWRTNPVITDHAFLKRCLTCLNQPPNKNNYKVTDIPFTTNDIIK